MCELHFACWCTRFAPGERPSAAEEAVYAIYGHCRWGSFCSLGIYCSTPNMAQTRKIAPGARSRSQVTPYKDVGCTKKNIFFCFLARNSRYKLSGNKREVVVMVLTVLVVLLTPPVLGEQALAALNEYHSAVSDTSVTIRNKPAYLMGILRKYKQAQRPPNGVEAWATNAAGVRMAVSHFPI